MKKKRNLEKEIDELKVRIQYLESRLVLQPLPPYAPPSPTMPPYYVTC